MKRDETCIIELEVEESELAEISRECEEKLVDLSRKGTIRISNALEP